MLVGLLAGVGACAARSAPLAAAPELPPGRAVRLGWRWVPGVAHAWRTRTDRLLGPVTLRRTEEWTYLAVDLDPAGIVHLRARRRALDVTAVADDGALPDAVLAEARALAQEDPDSAALSLRLSGRLVDCIPRGFAEALPHRLLGLHFPPDPLTPGQRWDDRGLVAAFEDALPLSTDTLRAEGASTLTDVVASEAGWLATVEHAARLQLGEVGPALELVGTTAWRTDPGVLAERVVLARWRPDEGRARLPVGRLRAHVQWLGEVDAA